MGKYVTIIDLGTTKIVCLIGEKVNNDKFYKVLAYNEAKSLGIQRGAVENIRSVVNTVTPILENIRAKVKIPEIKEVYVGIAGQHVKCIANRTEVSRNKYDKEITEEEIKQLELDAYKISLDPGEKILHAIPQTYSIDGMNNIIDPVGRFGHKLAGDFHIVVGNAASMTHTDTCITRMGLSLKQLVLEPIASARAVLTADEQEVGVVMVDIGGGTTDILIYKGGIVKYTAVIPFGGNIITEDIKKGYGILMNEAEQIKVEFGSCLSSKVSDDSVIELPGISGREPRLISVKGVACIIEARLNEIFDMILKVVHDANCGPLSAGIVLTGGVAHTKHIKDFVYAKTGMYVKIGIPENISPDSPSNILKPEYSTAVGLMMCGFDDALQQSSMDDPADTASGNGFMRRFSKIVKDFIIPKET
ncbi:MAG: cell division protein FtsA [Prevotellaceae bacterium]|jgi:cell division protein FtsA|nr:cell division protein FtsA [Prevotellaceae bacterium]